LIRDHVVVIWILFDGDVTTAYHILRSMAATYERDSDFHGIKTMRFSSPPNQLANVSVNPDNLCYCIEPTSPVLYNDTDHNATVYETEGCMGTGVMNLKNCLGN
jgi:hypothetical protein